MLPLPLVEFEQAEPMRQAAATIINKAERLMLPPPFRALTSDVSEVWITSSSTATKKRGRRKGSEAGFSVRSRFFVIPRPTAAPTTFPPDSDERFLIGRRISSIFPADQSRAALRAIGD